MAPARPIAASGPDHPGPATHGGIAQIYFRGSSQPGRIGYARQGSSRIRIFGRNRNAILEIAETLLLAALIFFATRLIVQNFRVEGPSMLPALTSSQFLLVNKLAYIAGEPERGDVIVFRSPSNPSEDLVKRVVALPSETVEIRDGFLFVDGRRLDEASYLQPSEMLAMSAVDVPENKYFVMGDNRMQSRDSRRLGSIAAGSIVGQVWLVYWPPDDFGLLDTLRPPLEPAPLRVAA